MNLPPDDQIVMDLQNRLDEKDAVIVVLLAEIESLKARVAELERQLGLNSSNSGKPPSTDGLKKPPRIRSLREPSKRPSGGQRGHSGETLRPVDSPDIIQEHVAETCAHCHARLTAEMITGMERRQVFDIPVPRLEVTEHRAPIYTCAACRGTTRADFPEEVTSPTQYGPRVRAAAVYLNAGQLIPEDRVAETIHDLFQVDLCAATVAAISARKAVDLQPLLDRIETLIVAAPVRHLDETGFRVGGRTQWLHVASTVELTHYRVSPKRASLPSITSGIVVHDHLKSYYTMIGVTHSLCNAHHLRELKALIEIEKEPWANKMDHLLRRANRAVRRAQDNGATTLPVVTQQRIMRVYDAILARGLAFHEAQPPLVRQPGARGRPPRRVGHNLLLRFQGYKHDVLRFVTDFTVPFTNNQAEQDLRMMKVKQKISGSFRSSSGAETFASLRSVLSTARKRCWDLLDTLSAPLQKLIAALSS
jgi:transposase